MYLFVNHFAFEQPKSGITDMDIFEALNNLGNLFLALKKKNVDLIVHNTLSQTSFNGSSIIEYIKRLDDITPKQALITLMGKIKPICTNTDTSFEASDSIAFGNCLEETEKIDISYTFLSCAMFHLNPILTINNLCGKPQFLNDTIKIICDEDKEHILDNYKLMPYEDVIKKIEQFQKKKSLDKYNSINNWDDYKDFVNTHFKFSKITDHCIKELKSRYGYSNSYSDDFKNKVLRINEFIEREGGNPKAIDFAKLSKKHYSPESSTRYSDLKKSHSGILNFSNIQVDLNWHTWVQDCRMYFEREDDHVCYVHYEKKIT
ncbi:MAG: hypothetical protein WC279_09960 [Sulfurimonas sp.]|jgi:hypothetical protein|uniref:hypothetical protein n=1 Tax=unclassified Sulfurimonas TaxID=2623549 RepID=UPI0008AB4488|nr:hypothetical protein [Sulfurimonas sp. RIFOXYB12_FULL_35_9]MDX9756028.1 hypothetical protein [Sulfurimonas sp.]OHE04057.1 MAG: hypothetical protein A2345_11355 [Sulfurimonas sp. RIFOXYB12_FULL_35_9]